MQSKVVDPEALFRTIVHVLQHGLRTSTYKLATMTALVDFSVEHHPASPSRPLDVPLSDISQRVMSLYWPQLKPFDGTQLHQSTQPTSRIIEAIEVLRSATGRPGEDLTFDVAAELAPSAFRREVDNVMLCLAQQPLPRLQRTTSSPRSLGFLFDDSFLHDKVTRAELARHRNIIQLKPGVAYGLAVYSKQLHRLLEGMWVDDVLRINKLAIAERTRVERILFGRSLGQIPTQRPTVTSAVDHPNATPSDANGLEGVISHTFATRLNQLFETARPRRTPGEVVAQIRKTGFPMTVGLLSRLRAGLEPPPSIQTINALANHFGVAPNYFLDREDPTSRQAGVAPGMELHSARFGAAATDNETSLARKPGGMAPAAPNTGHTATTDAAKSGPADDEDIWGRVFEGNLDDIASGCEIRDNGCWNRPSNTPVRCRPPGDLRNPVDLPKMNLHRWAWMVRNGYSNVAVPSYLVQVRRTCNSWTCCNPEHLRATSPGGAPLSNATIASLLKQVAGPGINPADRERIARQTGVDSQSRVALQDNLTSIRNHCTIANSGCWIARSSAPVACRAKGDLRPDAELPQMAPHRWAWMVTHGLSSAPLSSDEFHVRRSCGQKKCCHPEHLYLTDLSGRELSDYKFNELQKPIEGSDFRLQPSSNRLFADRLNKLFEASTGPDGIPYKSGDVAAELQEDGLAISEAVIDRLRSQSGDPPSAKIIEALAYFFNVEPDYFSAGSHSEVVRNAVATVQNPPVVSIPTVEVIEPETQAVAIAVDELGQIVTGLSEAISNCLAMTPAQTRTAVKLAPLLAEVGALLSEGDLVIERSLLQQIVSEWKDLADVAKHQELVRHLSRLASGDYY